MKIDITSLADYKAFSKAFIEPLLMPEMFSFENRKSIVYSLFGKASPETDQKFYRFMWESKPHWCENCGLGLKEFSSVYISHIKSRGAYTELRYEPLNINILCGKCHNKWEFSKLEDKKKMFIYYQNKINYEVLSKEYRFGFTISI